MGNTSGFNQYKTIVKSVTNVEIENNRNDEEASTYH